MRWGGAVLVVACCAVLAGCGGSGTVAGTSPTPITSSATSGSTSASPSTSATPTVDLNTDAAVVDAVDRYVAAYQTVARTASLSPLSGIVTADCDCRSGLEELVQQELQKHEHTDVQLKPSMVRVLSRKGARARVSFDLVSNAYEVLNVDGAVVQRAQPSSSAKTIDLQLVGATWLVYLAE